MIDVPAEPLPTQEQAIEERLLDCGLKLGGFTVKYEDYLQSIEIVIAPSAEATSADFACIKEAAGSEIVTFQDSEMFAAYMDIASQLARPELLVTFERRLKEAGLWERFPNREDFSSLEDYAEALEVHAGIEPRSALLVAGDTILFDPPSASPDSDGIIERYSNLLSTVAYASTKHRLSFGLLGNEKVKD